jgi:hypothetical protein
MTSWQDGWQVRWPGGQMADWLDVLDKWLFGKLVKRLLTEWRFAANWLRGDGTKE